jgi:predicted small lipoprotein YifL
LSRFLDRSMLSLAAAGALIACLALTGCGRKGPLDPPPGAALTGEPQPQQSGLLTPMVSPIGSGSGGTSSSAEPGIGSDGRPVAPKGPKRPFVLDGLLN